MRAAINKINETQINNCTLVIANQQQVLKRLIHWYNKILSDRFRWILILYFTLPNRHQPGISYPSYFHSYLNFCRLEMFTESPTHNSANDFGFWCQFTYFYFYGKIKVAVKQADRQASRILKMRSSKPKNFRIPVF